MGVQELATIAYEAVSCPAPLVHLSWLPDSSSLLAVTKQGTGFQLSCTRPSAGYAATTLSQWTVQPVWQSGAAPGAACSCMLPCLPAPASLLLTSSLDLLCSAVHATMLAAPSEWPSASGSVPPPEGGIEACMPHLARGAAWIQSWRPCCAALSVEGSLQARPSACLGTSGVMCFQCAAC